MQNVFCFFVILGNSGKVGEGGGSSSCDWAGEEKGWNWNQGTQKRYRWPGDGCQQGLNCLV